MRNGLLRAVCTYICTLRKSKRDKDRSTTPMLLCSCVCRLLVLLLGALVFISAGSLNERGLGLMSQGQQQGTAAQTADRISQHRGPQFEKSGSRKREETERESKGPGPGGCNIRGVFISPG